MQVDHEIMKVKAHVFLVQGLQHIVAVKWTLTSCDAFLMAFMSEKLRKEINCLTSISKNMINLLYISWKKHLSTPISFFFVSLKKNKTFKNCCCHGAWQLVGPCLCGTSNYCGAIFRMSTYSFPGQGWVGLGVKLSRWVKDMYNIYIYIYCFFCLG